MKIDPEGLLLLGGQATRFGAEKMSARLRGAPLYHGAFRALAATCPQIHLSLARPDMTLEDPPRVRGCTWSVVQDAVAGLGPLGGIHSAWRLGAGDLLVVAGDLPGLKARSLHRILDAARLSGAELVAARTLDSGREQPLCGLWKRSLAADLGHWLASGRRSVFGFLEGREILWVDVEDAQLININRPEDLDLLTRMS